MTTGEVLAVLRARDIRLMVDGDQLCYDAPVGAVTPEVVTLLREHKATLLATFSHATPTAECATMAPARPNPLTPFYPCVRCGNTDRWDDAGIWRCLACWPPGSLGKQAKHRSACGEIGENHVRYNARRHHAK